MRICSPALGLAAVGFAVGLPSSSVADPTVPLAIAKTSEAPATIRFPATAGTRYEVQSSTDLQTWKTIRTGLSGTDAEVLVDTLETEEGSMFYRVVIHLGDNGTGKTIKVTNTYTSGRPAGNLELGRDTRPFDPDAPKFDEDAASPGEDGPTGVPGGGGGGFVGDVGDPRLAEDAFFDGGIAPPGGGDFVIEPWPWPGPDPEPQPGANLLTAAEWNDHEHWGEFQTFLQEYPEHFSTWQLDHQRRVILRFVDPDDSPLHDVKVTFVNACFEGTQAHTHNDGQIPLFLTKEIAECLTQEELAMSVQVGGALYETSLAITEDDDQTWTLEVPLKKVSQARKLDLAWVVDVTGSMGDELRFIREELIDIVEQIRQAEQIDDVRIATIFYRDRGDQFVTKVQDFSDDLVQVQNDIEAQRASGGGDFPESVNAALYKAMRELSWRDEDTVRLLFLVADAPPHYYPDEQYTYRDAIPDAHASAIKLFPVAGSGIDKSTEYLFRNLAVASMGKYIFITDDSGIGGGHIDPDIEQFEVETLNAILIRTILEEYRRGL